MSERQRDTAFLTRIISYDDSAERRTLAEKIERVQCDERCLTRAAWLMALFAALALAGMAYAAVFFYYPMSATQLLNQFAIKVLCAIALGSLFCLVSFLALRTVYRIELARHREECRCLAMKLIEARVAYGVPSASSQTLKVG
jgi:hypothetical protein